MKEEDKSEVKVVPCVMDRNLERMSNCGMRTISKEKKTVNARHVTKLNTGEFVALDHVVDLSEFTDKEILEYAAKSVLIEFRGKEIKNMKGKEVVGKFTLGYNWRPDRSEKKRAADPTKKVVSGFEKADFTSRVQMVMGMFSVDEKTAREMVIKTMAPKEN